MRSLGIDIGRHSINVVEVLAHNRKYEITNAKEYKIFNVESSDQEIDIIQTLNTIAKEFDAESAKVTTSIRQQYVSTRKLFFPFKERAKIQKSLAFELEDDIPLSIEKAVYDSKIIKFHDKSAEVVAMACLRDDVAKTIELFEHSHMDPDIITPEFCALANLYEKWYKSPEEAAPLPDDNETETDLEKTIVTQRDKMIVHIGHSKTFVGVVSKDHLVWGRSIMWGAEKIAGAISQAFQVPFTAAHEMMPTKAFILLTSSGANKDQLKMSDTVSKSLEPLIQSIRLSIMLANTEYGANIDSIELIGGPANIKNLSAFLTQELERPTNSTNPLKSLNPQYLQGADRLHETFQMALGLAIEGLRRPFNPPVNFRQDLFAKKNQSFEKFWEKWSYTAKILATAYVCYFIYGIAIDSISTQLEVAADDVLKQQAGVIAGLKGSKATESQIRKYIRTNKKKAEVVKAYEQLGDLNSPVKFINDVSQILPRNKDDKSYDIRRFFVKESEVTIQGVADTPKTVDRISKALKGVALAGKVKVEKATIPQEPNKTSFAFSFKVKRKN